jgi:putative hydrolase of the HAD superfamily
MIYKAIGFDYGGVLTGITSAEYSEKIAALLDISKERYQQVYYWHNRKVNLGLISWRQLWELVLRDLGKIDKLDELLDLFNHSDFGIINQSILGLVSSLRSKGYKTGLLSNNTAQAAAKMRQQGLARYFDVLHISAETGFVKPELNAFEHFAESLKVTLAELIFIDDSVKSLSTAKDIGYHPILFKDYGSLVTDLTKLGVLTP